MPQADLSGQGIKKFTTACMIFVAVVKEEGIQTGPYLWHWRCEWRLWYISWTIGVKPVPAANITNSEHADSCDSRNVPSKELTFNVSPDYRVANSKPNKSRCMMKTDAFHLIFQHSISMNSEGFVICHLPLRKIIVGCIEDFTPLQRYFSHIATWNQDITILWKGYIGFL